MSLKKIQSLIRNVPDFPQKGILFRDITPVLQNPEAFKEIISRLAKKLSGKNISCIVGIEARGFIFGAALATKLGVSFVPIRKKGKLPWKTKQVTYALEYGNAAIEIHKDAIKRGDKVVVIDDLLATGGTAKAAASLVEKIGGKIVEIIFVIELTELNGRAKLKKYRVYSLIKY